MIDPNAERPAFQVNAFPLASNYGGAFCVSNVARVSGRRVYVAVAGCNPVEVTRADDVVGGAVKLAEPEEKRDKKESPKKDAVSKKKSKGDRRKTASSPQKVPEPVDVPSAEEAEEVEVVKEVKADPVYDRGGDVIRPVPSRSPYWLV